VSGNKIDSERLLDFDTRSPVYLGIMVTATKPGDVQRIEDPKFIEARKDEISRVWIDSPIGGTSEGDSDLFVPHEDYIKDPITGKKVEPETVKAANGLLLDSWKI
jgi:hypothetical protein